MPKSKIDTVEMYVNRALASLSQVERRWKGLTAEQKSSVIAALSQAVARVQDSDNRSSAFKF